MRAARLLAIVCLVAAPAFAGDRVPEDALHGGWAFETAPYRGGCILSGQFTLTAGAEPGRMACEFVATERCGGEDGRAITTSQTCQASYNGTALSVWSTLDGLMNAPDGYAETRYLPDHFLVEPQSPDLMTGTWYDLQTSSGVTFRREEKPMF